MLPSTEAVRQHAIQTAQQILQKQPVYLDTETTGLEKTDEIVEISIVDDDGVVVFSTLVKPSRPIPAEAERIHGITNGMVSSAPNWPVLWSQIRNHLYGKSIAAYNAPFDLRMMQQSHSCYRLPWRETFNMVDVLPLYSDFRGVWNPIRRSMQYFKLEEAGKFFNISLPNAHRSTADCLLTRALLHCIAGQSY